MKACRWIGLLAVGATLAGAAPGKVVVVRHAETVASTDPDRGLSEQGTRRMVALGGIMDAEHVTHVFTSQYPRAIHTAGPTAQVRGLAFESIDARQLSTLVDRVRVLQNDEVALIVGHSNTVPEIIAALGGAAIAPIAEDEYNRLVVLTFATDGTITTRERVYEPAD